MNRWVHKSAPGEIAGELAVKRAIAVLHEKNDSEKWTMKMDALKEFLISLLILLTEILI